MYTIFCDMDGVIVDFEKGLEKYTDFRSVEKPE